MDNLAKQYSSSIIDGKTDIIWTDLKNFKLDALFPDQLIEQKNSKIVLYATGCASNVLKEFTQYPGSSTFALEAKNLYGMGSTIQEYGGYEPSQYVSQEVSQRFAVQAFKRAHKILQIEQKATQQTQPTEIWSQCMGIGITGAIRSQQPKKGLHQCYISVITCKIAMTFYLNLHKEARSREQEESFISLKVWQIIQQASQNTSLTKQELEEELRKRSIFSADEIKCIQLQKLTSFEDYWKIIQPETLTFHNFQSFTVDQIHENSLMLSGSFNPVHKGHFQMLEEASKLFSIQQKILEITINNPDKGFVDYSSVWERIKLIFGAKEYNGQIVVISNKPLFVQKTSFIKNSQFLIGIDTLKRLIDTKYYENSQEKMAIALSVFNQCNISLCCFPRLDASTNEVEMLQNYISSIPILLQPLVSELKNFRIDLSSTQIRNQEANNAQQIKEENKQNNEM